jgi:hypothetical protein
MFLAGRGSLKIEIPWASQSSLSYLSFEDSDFAFSSLEFITPFLYTLGQKGLLALPFYYLLIQLSNTFL